MGNHCVVIIILIIRWKENKNKCSKAIYSCFARSLMKEFLQLRLLVFLQRIVRNRWGKIEWQLGSLFRQISEKYHGPIIIANLHLTYKLCWTYRLKFYKETCFFSWIVTIWVCSILQSSSRRDEEGQTPQQRQAAAKLALRKQLEKTLLQVLISFSNTVSFKVRVYNILNLILDSTA